MRRIKRVERAIVILLLLGLATGISAIPVAAETIAPSLVLTQLKITGSNGQFVVLYNTMDMVLDMSKYQLEYFNSFDLTKATSSRLIALSGSLPPHGYYMINDSQMLLCYRLSVYSVSLGFSSVAGLVQVIYLSQNSPGDYASTVIQDYVGWSKTTATGAQTLPSSTNASLLRQPVDAQNNPNISLPGSGNWIAVNPDSTNACDLVTMTSPITKITVAPARLLPPTQPPVITLPAPVSEIYSSAVNDGLMAPQITEILPNPPGNGNDSTDEFIEIYNANATTFDLSGYSLQTGTTALHSFVIPNSSVLAPQSYTVFYASQTRLSLSNSGGQVKLLDSSGSPISDTGSYSVAKDGQSWSLANGNWSWTSVPTPGTVNVMNPASTAKTAANATINSSTSHASSTSKTTSPAKASKSTNQTANLTPVHNWTLALVAVAALLYGAYEYRADLGNRINQLRRYFRHRRADWAPASWWRSHRTDQWSWRW